MITKSQKYSTLVFDDLEKTVQDNLPETLKKYRSLSKKAGGLLRTVGLIQFLTFLDAKSSKEKHHRILLESLFGELKKLDITKKNNHLSFIAEVRKAELPEYMYLTSNILALLQWHKRLSEILIQMPAEEEENAC